MELNHLLMKLSQVQPACPIREPLTSSDPVSIGSRCQCGRIRTSNLLIPNQARYQAALHTVEPVSVVRLPGPSCSFMTIDAAAHVFWCAVSEQSASLA